MKEVTYDRNKENENNKKIENEVNDEKKLKNNFPLYLKVIPGIVIVVLAYIIAKYLFGNNTGDQNKNAFTQTSEINKIKKIIIHIPEKELFMSTLHPLSALYNDITNDEDINKCFENLTHILKENNIDYITVSEALKLNGTELIKLAKESLTYKLDENYNYEKIPENVKSYINDEEKIKNLKKLSKNQLVNVLFTNPTYTLKPVEANNNIEPSLISFKPLGNLMFCRDQQITTAKGVVIGRMKSSQRKGELKIMEQVFKNLNISVNILTEKYDKNAYLEGGDYFAINKELSLLGVGLRTTIKGAEFLMENDLLGTRYFGIVYDNGDMSIQRSHLDTFFNILNDKLVILLDLNDEQGLHSDKKIERKVYLFDNKAKEFTPGNNNPNIPNESGEYKLIKIYEKFHEFLYEKGFNNITLYKNEQKEQMINFLNIGDNTIISNCPQLKEKVKKYGIKVIYLDFEPILKMGGSIRSITQVSRYD